MVAGDLRVTLNSDDPTMFHTDIGKEFVDLCTALDYGPAQVRRFCLDAVDGTWLDDSDKRARRARVTKGIDALDAELAGAA